MTYKETLNVLKGLEGIYPMTMIHTRHGRFAIVEAEANATCVLSLQEDEEYQYDPHGRMQKNHLGINYGWGINVAEALTDFRNRKTNNV